MSDIIEKVLGYIVMITAIAANVTVITTSRKPKSKPKRNKRR